MTSGSPAIPNHYPSKFVPVPKSWPVGIYHVLDDENTFIRWPRHHRMVRLFWVLHRLGYLKNLVSLFWSNGNILWNAVSHGLVDWREAHKPLIIFQMNLQSLLKCVFVQFMFCIHVSATWCFATNPSIYCDGVFLVAERTWYKMWDLIWIIKFFFKFFTCL